MVPIITSIEFIQDPALLVGFKDGSFRKLQPMVKNEDHPANSILLPSARAPFIILTDFEKERVKVDTSILTISGSPFSGTFEDLQAAIGNLVRQVNAANGGGNYFETLGLSGDWVNGQTIQQNIFGSSNYNLNRIWATPFVASGNILKFGVAKTGGLTGGQFNFGVYNSTNKGAGLVPTNKLFQSPEFTTSLGVEAFEAIPASPLFLTMGLYWMVINMNLTTPLRAAGSVSTYDLLGRSSLTGSNANKAFQIITPYVSSMPEVFDIDSATKNSSIIGGILFYKKQI